MGAHYVQIVPNKGIHYPPKTHAKKISIHYVQKHTQEEKIPEKETIPLTQQILENYVINKFSEGLKRIALYNDNFCGPTTVSTNSAFEPIYVPNVNLNTFMCGLVKCINTWMNKRTTIYQHGDADESELSFGMKSMLMAFIYMDRISKAKQDVFIGLNSKTIHRIIFTAFVLAIKFTSDHHPTLAWFSSLGGIDIQELKELEVAFCTAIDWKLYISEQNFYQSTKRFNEIKQQAIKQLR